MSKAKVIIVGVAVGAALFGAILALGDQARVWATPALFIVLPILLIGADFHASRIRGYIPRFHDSDLLPPREADRLDTKFHALERSVAGAWWVTVGLRSGVIILAAYLHHGKPGPVANLALTSIGCLLIGLAAALLASAAMGAHQLWSWRRKYDQDSADERRRREHLRALSGGGQAAGGDASGEGPNPRLHLCAQ